MTKNRWDIWLAKVAFADKRDIIKNRPVLIVEHQRALALSLKMTGTSRNEYYEIREWESAGLSKKTYIDTKQIIALKESDFIHRIGVLQPDDIRLLKNEVIKQRINQQKQSLKDMLIANDAKKR